MQKAGFLEHGNCIPFLAKHQASNRSKIDAEIQWIETLPVNLQIYKENKKQREEKIKEKHVKEMRMIEEKTKPLLLEFQKEKEKRDRIEECKRMFCGVDTKPLRDIPQGTYTVNAAKKKCNTMYGDQYIFLVQDLPIYLFQLHKTSIYIL